MFKQWQSETYRSWENFFPITGEGEAKHRLKGWCVVVSLPSARYWCSDQSSWGKIESPQYRVTRGKLHKRITTTTGNQVFFGTGTNYDNGEIVIQTGNQEGCGIWVCVSWDSKGVRNSSLMIKGQKIIEKLSLRFISQKDCNRLTGHNKLPSHTWDAEAQPTAFD